MSGVDVIVFLNTNFAGAKFFKIGSHYVPLTLLAGQPIVLPVKAGFFYPADLVEINGKDSQSFLQGLITNDIKLLESKIAIRSLITNQKGKILFDVFIEKKSPNQYLIYTQPGEKNRLIEFFQFYHITEEINIIDQAPEYLLYVLDNQAKYLNPVAAFFTDDKCSLAIYKPQNLTADLLLNAGLKILGIEEFDDIRPIFELARCGVDFNATHYPQEAALQRFVSYKKGCFIGQEPVARMFYKGYPTKQLCRLNSAQPLKNGDTITAENRSVGLISSSSHIKTADGYFSLGFVKTSKIKDNSALESTNTPLKVANN